ncbi:MAG: hypothetical protein ACI88A_002523 [Paraglaciecola sp.]|jgi:hypothetical protein
MLFKIKNQLSRKGTYYAATPNDNVTVYVGTEVSEPSTLAIFALGIIGLASRRFKKQF